MFLNYLLNAINMVAFYNTEGQILTLPSFPAKQIYINACKNEFYFWIFILLNYGLIMNW